MDLGTLKKMLDVMRLSSIGAIQRVRPSSPSPLSHKPPPHLYLPR
jgi:hypothetical protein